MHAHRSWVQAHRSRVWVSPAVCSTSRPGGRGRSPLQLGKILRSQRLRARSEVGMSRVPAPKPKAGLYSEFTREVELGTWPLTQNKGHLDMLTNIVMLELLRRTLDTRIPACPSKGHFHRGIRLGVLLVLQGRTWEVLLSSLCPSPEVPWAGPSTSL